MKWRSSLFSSFVGPATSGSSRRSELTSSRKTPICSKTSNALRSAAMSQRCQYVIFCDAIMSVVREVKTKDQWHFEARQQTYEMRGNADRRQNWMDWKRFVDLNGPSWPRKEKKRWTTVTAYKIFAIITTQTTQATAELHFNIGLTETHWKYFKTSITINRSNKNRRAVSYGLSLNVGPRRLRLRNYE